MTFSETQAHWGFAITIQDTRHHRNYSCSMTDYVHMSECGWPASFRRPAGTQASDRPARRRLRVVAPWWPNRCQKFGSHRRWWHCNSSCCLTEHPPRRYSTGRHASGGRILPCSTEAVVELRRAPREYYCYYWPRGSPWCCDRYIAPSLCG